VVAWYRDPARADHFTLESARREGDSVVLAGTGRRDRDRFTLRLASRGNGTEGRLLLADRD
jgi:hypothetical protein